MAALHLVLLLTNHPGNFQRMGSILVDSYSNTSIEVAVALVCYILEGL